ncbi:hypothetical protein [Burkholderia diffusa]|uniref:hypothetical protein n=1 Tax=Burkholderia diffusa TaxID=488732 RepID=UPI0012D92146|nr:hypothetical protein [Burkholderia diffusa]
MLKTFVTLRIAGGITFTHSIARLSTAITRDSRARLSGVSITPSAVDAAATHCVACRHPPSRFSHAESRALTIRAPHCFHRAARLITLLTVVCLVPVFIGLKSKKGRFGEATISITWLSDSAFFLNRWVSV